MSGPPVPQRVLVFAPSPMGGIAEHVHYQAQELARRGAEVTVLCKPDFIKPAETARYRQLRGLRSARGAGFAGKLARRLAEVLNYWRLAAAIVRQRPDLVLMEANTEFAALAWAWPHLLLAHLGTTYVANFHDPVRGAILGMRWYGHLLRVLAYGSLRGAMIHGPPPPGAWLPRWLEVEQAPLGVYGDLAALPAAGSVRERLQIPAEAFVLLAFGHIADRKNLDLLVRALPEAPGVHLLIAGPDASGRQRPAAFYRALADRLGVGDRVRVDARLIPEAELPTWFAAADAVALTYNAGFVSMQSGVLQIAAVWDKPILASGGAGPLRDAVERFGLGVFVAPDSLAAVIAGIAALRRHTVPPGGFAAYRDSVSWGENVDRLLALVARIKAGA